MVMTYITSGHKSASKSLIVLDELKVIHHNGRIYKLLSVETFDRLPYICIRLYNGKGHFIKQMLFEKAVAEELGIL